ncbi:MAG: hypothetical protein H0T56_14975 [Pseudaminobacter sp.]|nr:hypothetical protein [Pseudaminobacter sp.]
MRGIARVLESKQGEPANLFWRKTASTLYRQLLSQGHREEAAHHQIRRLLDAVLSELHAGSGAAGKSGF